MSAKPWPRIEWLKTVRFCFCCIHNFPKTDPHFMTEHRQLIDQTYINIAVCIFQDFFHFSHCRRRNLINIALQNCPIHSCNYLGCFLSYGSYHFWSIFRFIDQVAWIYSFRRKPKIKVSSAFQARPLFQNRLH